MKLNREETPSSTGEESSLGDISKPVASWFHASHFAFNGRILNCFIDHQLDVDTL